MTKQTVAYFQPIWMIFLGGECGCCSESVKAVFVEVKVRTHKNTSVLPLKYSDRFHKETSVFVCLVADLELSFAFYLIFLEAVKCSLSR